MNSLPNNALHFATKLWQSASMACFGQLACLGMMWLRWVEPGWLCSHFGRKHKHNSTHMLNVLGLRYLLVVSNLCQQHVGTREGTNMKGFNILLSSALNDPDTASVVITLMRAMPFHSCERRVHGIVWFHAPPSLCKECDTMLVARHVKNCPRQLPNHEVVV